MKLESKLRLSYGQASEKGPKESNEDCIGIRVGTDELLATKGAVCVIADGVSAAEYGKIASEACVQGFISDYYCTPDTWDVKKSTHTVLNALNSWLCSQGKEFQDIRKGYVTTLSILVLKSCQAHIFHIGDSRIYRCRDGVLELLTTDHSTRVSSDVCYLTRAMGMDPNLKIDYRVVDIQKSDFFLASTDGAHDFLSELDILKAIATHPQDPESACEQMAAIALKNGSTDNTSCALLQIEELPEAKRSEVVQKLHSLPFPPDLNPGMKLEGWKVEKLIHASPRSQLYLVSDMDTGESAVMKTPSVNYHDDPEYIERFLQEEWIAKRVDNPNLIKSIPRKTHTPSCLYHIWERIEGQSLTEWMAEHTAPRVEDIIDIISQAIRGIRALHRKGILHQDLKLDNILIHRGGTVKIIDLGSCYVSGLKEIASPIKQHLRLGTIHYTAPEYLMGMQPTRKSDQFSLATIAYKLFTCGQHPYGTAFEKAHETGNYSEIRYIPAATHNPMTPHWVDATLAKALNILPDDRYESFSDFLTDLQTPNPNLPKVSTPSSLLPKTSRKFWKRSALLLAVTQVITLLILYFKK